RLALPWLQDLQSLRADSDTYYLSYESRHTSVFRVGTEDFVSRSSSTRQDFVIGNCRLIRRSTDGLQNDPNANADGRQDRLNQAWLRQTLRRFHREEGQGYSGG